MKKKLILVGVALLVALIAAGWFFHGPLLAWHYVGQLESSPNETTLDHIASIGEDAVPPLMKLFQKDDQVCGHAAQAFLRVMDRWSQDDPRAARAARRLADSAEQFSSPGKVAALDVADSLLARGGECKESALKLVKIGLKDNQVSSQVKAIILALKPEFGLAAEVVPLLKDSKPEVRRTAMLGIGPLRDIVPDDDILPSLHDPDGEVRALCETALKSRGLREKDVLLGRLITDPSPLKRMEVIRFLPNDSQLDPQAWLNRLCQDPSPIVRASAARVVMDPSTNLDAGLAQQVRRMAQVDPDGTVRQIAEYLVRSQASARH